MYFTRRYVSESLEIAKARIQVMIDKGMDNEQQVLQGLIDKANGRIAEIRRATSPRWHPMRTPSISPSSRLICD